MGAARLLASLRWLIRLRWWAFAGVGLTVAAAAAAGSVASAGPLALVVVALGAANLLFDWRARRLDATRPGWQVQREIVAHLLLDLVVLTAVLRLSGGVDNPFASFYVFHMALAAMLLPFRRALLIGAAGLALHSAELLATALDLVPHVPVLFGANHLHEALHGLAHEAGTWRSGLFIVGYLVAFSATQLGVIYFVGTLARRHREAERQRLEHERVARSRERLARLGTVAGGVAHAVRNPLHGLVQGLDILRRGGADPELLDLMGEGVQRIERVTQRLLALGRDEPLRRVALDARELLEDVIRLVRGAIGPRGIELALEVRATEPLRVRADPDRLAEAIVNLVDNAVHASPPGGTVTVRLDAAPGSVVVEVLDRGPGIPAEHQARIFDPFFTTKAVGEGTGLGLAITRTVVEGHGGEIRVLERAGGGTLVRLILPAGEGP